MILVLTPDLREGILANRRATQIRIPVMPILRVRGSGESEGCAGFRDGFSVERRVSRRPSRRNRDGSYC